ncbi:MAG: tRNA (adenosine(37)-N6)-dimethylallyltransferase MiaA [SAR324 cluster bacterium]|nr:tRNA (adenosine(37)-N6)-dimethylallyltransferase MiaA [SAR324 cluster bacterium]
MPRSNAEQEAAPQRMIAVVGPTASGKSALALRLAQALGGEIISTDSMQVYRHLDIGTAKATARQRRLVPHHLLDMVNPDEPYSAGRYTADAARVIARLGAQGKAPLLCGGTGLYFRALLFGLADIPGIPSAIRERVQRLHGRKGLAACREELKRLDARGAAALHPNDKARNLRALEVVLATGRPIHEFQQATPFRDGAGNVLSVGIAWQRPELYSRIADRVAAMLEGGWVEEVRRVLEMGYHPEVKPLRAIGYKEIAALLQAKRDQARLAEDIAQRTRNYAKRQLTWLRKHPGIFWCAPGEEDKILERAQFFLKTGK